MASSSSQTKPLTISRILLDSCKLSTKSPALVLPILLLTSLTSYLSPFPPLLTAFTAAVVATLNSKDPTHTTFILNTLHSSPDNNVINAHFPAISVLYIIGYSLISVATVHVLSLQYSDTRMASVRDVLRAAITSVCVTALNLACNFLLVTGVGAVVYVAGVSKVTIALAAILAVSGLFLDFYLTMVWSASLVVSVVEDNCYGLGAIAKAQGTVRGRWRQGGALVFVLSVMSAVVGKVCGRGQQQQLGGFDVGLLVCIATTAVMSVYERAIGIVFYQDCKKINSGEEMEIDAGCVYIVL